MVEQRSTELINVFVAEMGDDILADASADQGGPLPPPPGLIPQSGGPEESGGARNSRPPIPFPGAGQSPTVVDQNPAASAATSQQVRG